MVSGQLLIAAAWCYGHSFSKLAVNSSGAIWLLSPAGLSASRPGVYAICVLNEAVCRVCPVLNSGCWVASAVNCLFLFLFSDPGSSYVVQEGFQLVAILLPLLPEF